MADSIPADKEVAVVFTSALIFGMYIITLFFCVRWLLFCDEGWRLKECIRWTIVTTTLLIFTFNLVYLVLSLRSTMAMVKYLAAHPDGPGYQSPPWDSIIKVGSPFLSIVVLLTID